MISRDDAAFFLDEQFSSLAVAVGQDPDPEEGYGPDIDNALRKLGLPESELEDATVEDGGRDGYFVLCEYYAARRIWRLLGALVDTTTGDTSYKFDGQRKQAESIMKDAKESCVAFGYDVGGGGWSVGYMLTDSIEPEWVY
jgi:hypothetical protein